MGASAGTTAGARAEASTGAGAGANALRDSATSATITTATATARASSDGDDVAVATATTAELGSRRLSAHGLGVRVDGRRLVAGVELELLSGEVLAVLGPNGAGKSTLLSLLAGDLEPSEGTVLLDELTVHRTHPLELARRRAVLPQQNRLSFPFTVRQVAEMGRSPWVRADDGDDEAIVDRAIARVDLSAFTERTFPSLSGGEQARASLARVLAQQAGVLLLDEPTAALDLAHQEQVMAIARMLADEGAAVLAVLHDLSLAAAWADRLALMSAGRLVALGAPAEVLDARLLEDVYGIPVEVFSGPGGELVVAPRRSRPHSARPHTTKGS